MNFDTPNDFLTVKIDSLFDESLFKRSLTYCETIKKWSSELLLNYMSAVIVFSDLTPDIEPILKKAGPMEKVNWKQEGF